MEEMLSIIELLTSSTVVTRNKGVEHLNRILEEANHIAGRSVEAAIVDLLSKPEVSWETRHGALMGARAVVCHPTYRASVEDFELPLKVHAVRMLEDGEYRVRLAAGDLIGVLCQKNGCQIYVDIKHRILDGIIRNLDENGKPGSNSYFPSSPNCCPTSSANESMQHSFSLVQKHCTSAEEIFNDTVKWKNLETWLRCLSCIVDGCGQSFNSHIDNELIDLLGMTSKNWSPFVREASCAVLSALINTNISQENMMMVAKEDSNVYRHAETFSNLLSLFLSDDCSQVRMSASLIVRKFLLGAPDGSIRQLCLTILLPPLCFNRYYTAEGVRLFSQETWMTVTSGEGKRLVEEHIDQVIDFDLMQLKVNNHEVKETACTCIREMAQKISTSVFQKFVGPVLAALKECLTSDIWTVRDAALVTCGNIISSFPELSRVLLSELNQQFYICLEDNVAPVREAAAIALGCTVKAYGCEVLLPIIAKIKNGLEAVVLEKPNEERLNKLDVPVKNLNADISEQSEKAGLMPGVCVVQIQPKGTQNGIHIQCETHQRSPEPWELADGCLCLMCELAKQPACIGEVTKLLPLVSKAASFNHYSHHVFFLQSVCKQLPVLFKNLGKRPLKLYVEIFFDIIFGAAASDQLPVSTAANECISHLSELLGSSIFHARVESYNPRYMQYLKGSVSRE